MGGNGATSAERYVEFGCGNLDRACIYVLVYIDVPELGQYYCIIHLFILSRVIVLLLKSLHCTKYKQGACSNYRLCSAISQPCTA